MENRRNIKMVDYQWMVAEFMRASGQSVASRRVSMTLDQASFRHSLFQEEVEELAQAILDGDRIEQLDALADILYIAFGTANTEGFDAMKQVPVILKQIHTLVIKDRGQLMMEYMSTLENVGVRSQATWGIREVFKIGRVLGFDINTVTEAFELVHASNMTKFCKSEAEAEATVTSYGKDIARWEERDGLYVVLRKGDGKVLKSINYEPVSLKGLIN